MRLRTRLALRAYAWLHRHDPPPALDPLTPRAMEEFRGRILDALDARASGATLFEDMLRAYPHEVAVQAFNEVARERYGR